MAFSRYTRAPVLDLGAQFGTSEAIRIIRNAVKNNTVETHEIILRGAERLDTMAGSLYGDGRYWWVLAAASNIGWGMQVPPGTVITVLKIDDVALLVG